MKWALLCMLAAACSAASDNDKPPVTPTGEMAANAPYDGSQSVAASAGDAGSGAAGAAEPEPAAPPEPVKGPFNEARVQEIVRANFEKMGACYAEGLKRDRSLKGTINVNLTIDGEGAVVSANAPKSEKKEPPPPSPKKVPYWQRKKPKPAEELITDTSVVSCVEDEFKTLRFPPTGRGLVTIVYPVVFRTE